jgi:hypothetical protein
MKNEFVFEKKVEKLKVVFESKVESQKLFEVLKIVQNLTKI